MRNLLVVILVLAAVVGCNRPKTIPDADLQKIIEEVFLVNAYISTHPTSCDSIDVYEPILKKYGYTAADMSYTVSSFSRRKSSRFTDVINEAITALERGYEYYESRVAVLDTIDAMASRRFMKVVKHDSLIVAKSLRDTVKLKIKLPTEEGRYTIAYRYFIDSADTNYGLKATYSILDSLKKSVESNTVWLRLYTQEKVFVTLESPATGRELEIKFASYNNKSKKPSIKIDSLVIAHYMPKKAAIDSINKTLIDYKLLVDDKEYRELTQDSCSLRIHPPRSAAQCDSVR